MHVCLSVSLSIYISTDRISMCMEYMDGGSLDTYGAIPEQVFGRVAVSVRVSFMKLLTNLIINFLRLSVA